MDLDECLVCELAGGKHFQSLQRRLESRLFGGRVTIHSDGLSLSSGQIEEYVSLTFQSEHPSQIKSRILPFLRGSLNSSPLDGLLHKSAFYFYSARQFKLAFALHLVFSIEAALVYVILVDQFWRLAR